MLDGRTRGGVVTDAPTTADTSLVVPPTPMPPTVQKVAARAAPWLGSGLALTLAVLGFATMGFNRARLGGLTVSDLLFASCALLIVTKLLAGDNHDLAPPSARRTSPLLLCGSLLLLTSGTLSTFRSWDPLGSLQVVLRFAWLTLVWFWLLRAVARDRQAFYKLLSGWRFAILTSSLVAIAGQLGIYDAGGLYDAGSQIYEKRQMAFMQHPNELAALLVFSLPLFLLDAPRPPGKAPSTLRRAGLSAIVLAAVMTTGSMTALFSATVAVIACAVAVPAWQGRLRLRRHTGLVAMVVAVLAVGGLVVAGNSGLPVFERITRFQAGDSEVQNSVGTRADMNRRVISHLDSTLVIGTGLQLSGNNDDDVARIGDKVLAPDVVPEVHNMYLKLIHEAGVPGLIALATVVLTAMRQAWRVALSARGTDLQMAAVALLVGIVAAITMGNFAPIAYQRYYWAPVALASCLWALRRHELRKATAGAPRPAIP